ncbi:hypothetical protein ACF0H5_017663 [Mactra antiquata]
MKIVDAFVIFLLACALTYNVFESTNSLEYSAAHFPVLDNLFIDDQFFLKEVQHVSKIECSISCSREAKCVCFFYNYPARKCRLHSSRFYNVQEGTSVSNWTYYMLGEGWCPVHDGFIHERSYNMCIHISSGNFDDIYTARSYCQSKGAAVISANTQLRATGLSNIMSKMNTTYIEFNDKGYYQLYIGLEYVNNTWTWDDGSVISSVQNWGKNDPDDIINHVCATICKTPDSSWNWTWNNVRCTAVMHVICEIV